MKTEKQEKSESKMVAESRRTEDRKKETQGWKSLRHSLRLPNPLRGSSVWASQDLSKASVIFTSFFTSNLL